MKARALILVFVVSFVDAAPALAAQVTSNNPDFISLIAPTDGKIAATTDSASGYITQWMLWRTTNRMSRLRGANSAYEHEAFFEPGGCWAGDYNRFNWESNLPYPYLDTNVDDDESKGESRAGGSGRAEGYMRANAWYYHFLRLRSKCTTSERVKINTQDSYRKSPDWFWCTPGYEWCVFPHSGSPRDLIPYSAGMYTRTSYSWHYNLLRNTSFESDTAYWVKRPSTANWAVYSTGWEPPKRLDFNCGGASTNCSIYQDVPWISIPEDEYTYEVALRCPSAYSSACPVTLALWGLGYKPNENAAKSYSVPNDGKWHLYRFRSSYFNLHDKLRFEIYNGSSSKTVHVDFTTLHYRDRVW